MCIRDRIGPVYPDVYSTKYASFLAVSYLTFTNELYQLWSYWTEFHEIFTLYRGIIYAVNAHIVVAISHSVSECQSDEIGSLPFFSQNWLSSQWLLRYRKKRSRSIICTHNTFIRWKNCENRSSGNDQFRLYTECANFEGDRTVAGH